MVSLAVRRQATGWHYLATGGGRGLLYESLAVDFANGERLVLKGSVRGVGGEGVGGEGVLGRYTRLH